MKAVTVYRVSGLEDDGTISRGPWCVKAVTPPVVAGTYVLASEARERGRVLVEALKLVISRNDRLKLTLRTIKTDKSFGPNAERLLRELASLSLLEEAKQTNIDHACRAALAAKEG